jgi:hypothetical protein
LTSQYRLHIRWRVHLASKFLSGLLVISFLFSYSDLSLTVWKSHGNVSTPLHRPTCGMERCCCGCCDGGMHTGESGLCMMDKTTRSRNANNGSMTCSLVQHGCTQPNQTAPSSLERLFSVVPSSATVLYPNAGMKYPLLALSATSDQFTSPPFHPPRG